MQPSHTSSTSRHQTKGKWIEVSAKTVIDWPLKLISTVLENGTGWSCWLPGASEESAGEEAPSGSLTPTKGTSHSQSSTSKVRSIQVRTEFFSARLELPLPTDELSFSNDQTSEALADERPRAREYILEASELVMGPITQFQLIVRLEPTNAFAMRRAARGMEHHDAASTIASILVRWRGNIPYFGILFRPLFASYFKSYAKAALESFVGSVSKLVSERQKHKHDLLSKGAASSSLSLSPRTQSLQNRPAIVTTHPWWAPAQPLSVQQTRALAALCFYAMVMGYMTSLAGIAQHQVIESFHADDAALGSMLFALNIGALPGIFLLPLGDRVGRRKILLPALAITAIASGMSALSPNLWTFTLLQALVRAPLFVALSLAWIYLVEEMPPRGRAYAISLFTMTGGLGGGIGLLSLPLVQHLSRGGWRILFAAGIATLAAIPSLVKDLPETHRFTKAWHGASPLFLLKKPHLRRILILLGAALAASVFGSPAARYQGRYIQNALGYTPGMYVLFTVVTTLPAAPGMLIGGRIADSLGRKTVGILAATVGALSQALQYWLSGAPLWISSAIGSFVGAMWIPAMGSFSTELFPTSLRANASSATSAVGMAGGAAGSLIAGSLIVSMGSYAKAITALLPAALVSGLLVLLLFPETKGKELDEISPEIGPPTPGITGSFVR